MTLLLLSLCSAARAAEPAGACTAWGEASASVTLEGVAESSGLAYVDALGVLFTVQDAGNDATLHVFDLDGGWIGEQPVRGATNTDWEDLAAGPCPRAMGAGPDATCLWIADVGDNDAVRDTRTLWVVKASVDAVSDPVACVVQLPDRPRDVEALLVAPDGTVRLVSKESGEAHVYVRSDLRCDGEPELMIEETRIEVSEPITGGASDARGETVVLRGARRAWAWPACGGTPDWSAAPADVTLATQVQGEAVALGPDGALYTTSEGDPFQAIAAPCVARAEPLPCATCGCGPGTRVRSGVVGWLVTVASSFWICCRRTRSARAYP